MTSPIQALEATLHQEIPLTRAMGLRVASWQDLQLQLDLPLSGNTNHTGSAFGGSLYSAAVLAGWGWLQLRQQDAGLPHGQVVIQDGQIEYPLPVFEDARAICTAPDEALWNRFSKTYQRHGRARLGLTTRILLADGREAVRFAGQYVLQRLP